jgi:hypothetical protein
MGEKPVVFDLRGTKDLRPNRNARWIRWISAAALVLVGALFVYAAIQIAITGSGDFSHLLALGLGLFVLIMCGLIFTATRPQADYLEVSSDGLALRFPNGKSLVVGWKDPDLNLSMATTQGASDGISAGQPIHALVCGKRRRRTYVTSEAFQEIIRQGRLCGVPIEARPSPHPGWTRYGITDGR